MISKTTRWTMSAVLVLLTMEICARLDDHWTQGAPLFGPWDISTVHEFDAKGQKGRPGARFGKWRMSSLGFRGPELTAGSVRVLVIGSSETFGQYESENMEWPRQLEAALNRLGKGSRFNVVNTAIAGETLPSSLKRLEERLAVTHPAAVVIYPSLVHYLWVPYVPEKPLPPPETGWSWRLQGRLSALLKRAAPQWLQTQARVWQTDRAARQYQPVLAGMPPVLKERFRADLTSLLEAIQARGIQSVLVTHANRFGPAVRPEERDMLLAWRRFYPMLAAEGFLPAEHAMNQIMRDVGRERRVPVVDAATRMPAGPQYFADFVHFTDKGAGQFAAMVAETLASCMNGSEIRCSRE